MVHQRGNQRDGSPNYVFLYSSDDDDEDAEEDGNLPLKVMAKHRSNPRRVEVIEVEVKSEDTLQALSLRYRCTISELKRINKIHKDNEIFAHRYIKVPIQPYSILTEKMDQPQLINLLDTTNAEADINRIILNSTVEPLVHQASEELVDAMEHSCTDRLIGDSDSLEMRYNGGGGLVDSLKCSGADWGLSWFQLVCFFLILGVAGPIIYVIYIAEKEHELPTNRTLHENAT